jgi:hypothetical protein
VSISRNCLDTYLNPRIETFPVGLRKVVLGLESDLVQTPSPQFFGIYRIAGREEVYAAAI